MVKVCDKCAFSIRKHCQHVLVRPYRENLKTPFCNKTQNLFPLTSFHKQKMINVYVFINVVLPLKLCSYNAMQ